MRGAALLWASLAAFLADQGSKYAVVHAMDLARIQTHAVFPPLLTFRYGENRGINFGLFDGSSEAQRWVLIGFSVLVALAVIAWILRSGAGTWMQISAGLLVGGALGNVVDRILYGYVLDFLNMSCCGIDNPFVFNVADVFIFMGAFGLVLADLRSKEKKGA